jgi:hypothetical protein
VSQKITVAGLTFSYPLNEGTPSRLATLLEKNMTATVNSALQAQNLSQRNTNNNREP